MTLSNLQQVLPPISKREDSHGHDCPGNLAVATIALARTTGLPLDDPRVSPIHTDFAGFPPMPLYGGSDDLLVTDARALKAKCPAVDYFEAPDSMHIWPVFRFSESRQAQARIADCIQRVTGG